MSYIGRDESKRAAFLETLARLDASKLIYLDESGFDNRLVKRYGWCPKGQLLYGEVTGKRKRRVSLIAGLKGKELIAPMRFEGSCNKAVFNAWLEQGLLPHLAKGSVLILDNAAFHKSEKTRHLVEAAGCFLLFLPPYSPHFNPIENYWAILEKKILTLIPKYETLEEAIDELFVL